jgi:hypothetical protein
MRLRTLLAVCSLPCALSSLPAHAATDTGRAMLAAHAACDGSLFKALAADATRWKKEPSFIRVGKLASFTVEDRKPREYSGNSNMATAEFARPPQIGGLPLEGWFDADLSTWSRFADAGVGFIGWGFYVSASPANIRDAMIRIAPAIGNRLQPSTAPKEGVFCVEETWRGGKWAPHACTADEDFPTDPTPHRWLVIRPDGPDGDRTVLSCELAGKLPADLLRQLRPDLPM